MKLKKAIAAVTAISAMSSMCAMTVFAEGEWNTNGGTAEVEGVPTIVSPTIEVELPGDLSFGLNPLKMNVSENPDNPNTNPIISGDYYVTNYSNIPVAVRTTTFVSAANDKVELKTSMAKADWAGTELKKSDTAGNKAIWLTQLYATNITTDAEGVPTMTTTAITPGTTVSSGTTGYLMGDTLKKSADGTDISQKPVFVLNTYDESDPTKWSGSMAGFRFDGAVDPNAVFEDGDVTVKAVFELKTLTAEQAAGNFEAYKNENAKGGFYSTIKGLKSPAVW